MARAKVFKEHSKSFPGGFNGRIMSNFFTILFCGIVTSVIISGCRKQAYQVPPACFAHQYATVGTYDADTVQYFFDEDNRVHVLKNRNGDLLYEFIYNSNEVTVKGRSGLTEGIIVLDVHGRPGSIEYYSMFNDTVRYMPSYDNDGKLLVLDYTSRSNAYSGTSPVIHKFTGSIELIYNGLDDVASAVNNWIRHEYDVNGNLLQTDTVSDFTETFEYYTDLEYTGDHVPAERLFPFAYSVNFMDNRPYFPQHFSRHLLKRITDGYFSQRFFTYTLDSAGRVIAFSDSLVDSGFPPSLVRYIYNCD